ncbi:MAG TPA: hypothetical protein VGR02_07855 [Thermoanaerobaculia bacterium]|jgi:hypothetical protein|nr:hypothetical protein [Thermoanaerobaculia bacterium]
MKITDIYANTFPALRIDTPAAADIDRPRLIRRIKSPAYRHGFREANIIPYQHAPFDLRWVHVDPSSYPAQSERRSYLEQVAAGTEWIGLPASGAPFFARIAAAGDARMIATRANLTREARHYLLRLGLNEEDLFHHVVAWLAATRDASRIPLPEDRAKLRMSASLGQRVSRLFNPDESLMTRPQEPELRSIAAPTRVGKEARMLRGSVLRVEEPRVTVRPFAADELPALTDFGDQTCDIHLNEKAYWKNVPLPVWEHGALRDWLHARRASALERPLNRDEAAHFSTSARRIASLLLLAPALAHNAELLAVSPDRPPLSRPPLVRTRESPFAS